MLKSNGELDPAQAISYPLPLKILLLSLNGFISASFERLETVSYTHLTLPTNREV